MFSQSFAVFSLLGLANAHFNIEYPEPRGDPFAADASEWIYPCKFPNKFVWNLTSTNSSGANVNQTAQTNRTLWPLTGGSLSLDLHHPWTYYFVNLGLGTDYPAFNISLTPQPINETGNGTLCTPHVALPAGLTVTEGQNASIQIVTIGQTGSALYNVSFGMRWTAK
jgi:hypothetical protein